MSQGSGFNGDGIVGPDREAVPSSLDTWRGVPTDDKWGAVPTDDKWSAVPTDSAQYGKRGDVATDAPALSGSAGFTGSTGGRAGITDGTSRTGLIAGGLLALLLLTGGGVFLMAKQGVFGCQAGTTPRALVVKHSLSQCQSSQRPNPGVSDGVAATSTTAAAPTATVAAPTATPAAVAPPTAAPAVVVSFGAGPQSFNQDCGQSSLTTLPSFTVTLDNSRSTVDVSWNVEIVDHVGASGHLWASASPTSGIVPAGQTRELLITPESAMCNDSQNVVPDATYHAGIVFSPVGPLGNKIIISDHIKSPVPQ